MAIDASGINAMKVIVCAKFIEDGTTVTKVKGQKTYILKRSIKIYGENRKEITCDSSCVFLMDNMGNIDMIPEDKELIVHVHPEDLMYDIQEAMDEDETK